jgi:hypothetical protein
MLELSLIGSLIGAISKATDYTPGQQSSQDVMDAVRALRDAANGPSSLSKKAKKGIYEFPFIITSEIASDPKSITYILKSAEVEYGNMLIVSASINPMGDPRNAVNIQRTLSQYHNNANDYSFSYEDAAMSEFEGRSIDDAYNEEITREGGRTFGPEGEITYKLPGGAKVRPFRTPNPGKGKNKSGGGGGGSVPPPTDTGVNPAPGESNVGNSPTGVSNAPYDVPRVSMQAAGKNIAIEMASKFNATIITITIRVSADKNSDITIPIGIKAIPHCHESDLVCKIISSYVKTKSGGPLVRFLRWRSGELRGIHNLLFRYDEIKRDVDFIKRVGNDTRWAYVLKSRAQNHKVNFLVNLFAKALGKDKVRMPEIMPNASFILSKNDIDTIDSETGVNLLEKPQFASKLLDDMMALGIYILDMDSSVVHVMFSGDKDYARYHTSALKTKSDAQKDDIKILLDMMARQVRI